MNKTVCQYRYRNQFRAALIGFVSFFLIQTSHIAVAQDKEQPVPEETVPIEIEKSTSEYEYEIEDRPDPFAPFVSGQARENTIPTAPDEILEVDEPLTGMQLFEPGQLTLVALMMTGGETLAMVQDFTGRGYVVTEGTKIGRRGIITEITEDRVLIEETSKTRSGKILKNEIAMVLKQEGE